jgi:hypothetical protein
LTPSAEAQTSRAAAPPKAPASTISVPATVRVKPSRALKAAAAVSRAQVAPSVDEYTLLVVAVPLWPPTRYSLPAKGTMPPQRRWPKAAAAVSCTQATPLVLDQTSL